MLRRFPHIDLLLWMIFVTMIMASIIIPSTIVLLVLTDALPQFGQVLLEIYVTLGDFVAMTLSFVGFSALVIASATMFVVLKCVGVVSLVWMGISVIWSVGSVAIVWIKNVPHLSMRVVFCNGSIITSRKPKGIIFFIFCVPEFIWEAATLMPKFSILATINVRLHTLRANRLSATICKLVSLGWVTRIGGNVLITIGVLTPTLRKAA